MRSEPPLDGPSDQPDTLFNLSLNLPLNLFLNLSFNPSFNPSFNLCNLCNLWILPLHLWRDGEPGSQVAKCRSVPAL
jgi:hypothetical protein